MKAFLFPLKLIGLSLLTLLVSLLVWANWEEPPLHAQAKPVNAVLFRADNLTTEAAASQLQQLVENLPGVTACAANPVSQLVGVTFYADQISEKQLESIIRSKFRLLSKPSFAGEEPTGPQCPVPAEYILKLEQLKYALCFR